MPSLTVCIPVHNAMPYLPAAVESILGQSFSDFQLLIIDDGSTDGSAVHLAALSDPRVTVVSQENRGLGTTLNRSLELCETEFYARMDADDVAHRERLEAQLEFLRRNSEVVLVGSQVRFLVGKTTCAATRMPLDHATILTATLKGNVAVCHPSVMMRTRVANQIGRYRIGRAGEDFDFILRMSEQGRVANLSNVFHFYRIHLDSIVMKRHDEVECGMAYAIACYRQRKALRPEPTFELFAHQWQQRGTLRKFCSEVRCWSGTQYRKAILDFGNGRQIRGGARLACAAACRPSAALRHAVARFRGRTDACPEEIR